MPPPALNDMAPICLQDTLVVLSHTSQPWHCCCTFVMLLIHVTRCCCTLSMCIVCYVAHTCHLLHCCCNAWSLWTRKQWWTHDTGERPQAPAWLLILQNWAKTVLCRCTCVMQASFTSSRCAGVDICAAIQRVSHNISVVAVQACSGARGKLS